MNGGCHIWNYLPSSLVASGKFYHSTGLAATQVGNQKLPAYLSVVNIITTSKATDKDLQALKSLIVSYANLGGECKGQLKSADDVFLQAASVESSNTPTQVISATSDIYSAIAPTYNTGDDYLNPMSPESVSYVLDASDPQAPSMLKGLQELSMSMAVPFGSLTYRIEGIVSKVNSHLRMDTTMIANFISAVKQVSCHEGSSSAGANGDISQGFDGKDDRRSTSPALVFFIELPAITAFFRRTIWAESSRRPWALTTVRRPCKCGIRKRGTWLILWSLRVMSMEIADSR